MLRLQTLLEIIIFNPKSHPMKFTNTLLIKLALSVFVISAIAVTSCKKENTPDQDDEAVIESVDSLTDSQDSLMSALFVSSHRLDSLVEEDGTPLSH